MAVVRDEANVCAVCQGIPWVSLPFEDCAGYLHQPTKLALINSAESCRLCELVLHAALSHCRNRDRRYGLGFWSQYHTIKVREGPVSELKYIQVLGASSPGERLTLDGYGVGIRAASGHIDSKGMNLPEELSNRHGDDMEDPPDCTPVYVYGNFWSTGEGSVVRLMGVGARFGTSPSPLGAYKADDYTRLQGSLITLCISDGKLRLLRLLADMLKVHTDWREQTPPFSMSLVVCLNSIPHPELHSRDLNHG
jgi:hypothetical protein